MSLESRDDLASELLAATQDEVGETPLFEALEGLLAFCITAAAVGNSEIVSLLLLSSANPNHISHQEMVARFSGREVDPKETEAATSTLSASLQSQVLDHIARTNSPSDSKAEALSPPHGQLEPATGPEDQEPKTDIGPVGDPSEPTGQEDSDHPPSPAGEAESKEPEMQRSGAVPEPTSPGTPRAEREGAAQVGSLTGSTDPARPDQSEEQEVRPPEEQTEVRPDESVKAGSATEPGPKPLSSLHVIEHSPMVAVRSQPWMQSPVIAHLRPGQHVNLGEWDATQQWRRVVSEDGGWLPVWHPTLGCLVTLVGVEAYPLKRDFDRLPGPSVSEVWEELYSNGCLNVPPPEHTETGGGGVGGTMAAKALMEVMTMGRAQTSEGEMALASLDPKTVEHVMKAALQHLRNIGRPLD
ncbi:PUMP5 [Symbiodinium sp. KB8]|nr:PUMP5 [Symbiodinium sp. KB8]